MASTYLSRTGTTATDGKEFTLSLWFKRANLGGTKELFCIYLNNTDRLFLRNGGDDFEFQVQSKSFSISGNRQFRDTSAWYHFVVTADSTEATDSDRIKWYVNGERQTITAGAGYPALNNVFPHGQGSANYYIGNGEYNSSPYSNYWDGSMSHVHFIDGIAYDASAFGETDATTGIWKPKTAPSVTYGTNGFFLKFENSGAFGTDSSGNANNFTVNGTMTQTIDTPSNVFATLNPLILNSTGGANSLSNGNLTGYTQSTAYFGGFSSTIGVSSGKYYWEIKNVSTSAGNFYSAPGITTENYINFVSSATRSTTMAGAGMASQNESWQYKIWSGNKEHDGVQTAYGSTASTGDIIGVALDLDNHYLYFSKNGVWQNSGDPTSGATGTGSAFALDTGFTYFPILDLYYDNTSAINFGNGYFGTTAVSSAQNPDDGIGIFEYAVPTGYKALCTKSINAQEYD